MQSSVLSVEEARAASIDVIEDGRGAQAVHDLVTALRANRRTGSASTKTRGEVRGSTKKIYRQKGTGNARHGDRQAPIFVGGGVVFGPRPHDYRKKVSKSSRRLAFRAALSSRILGEDVTLVDDIAASDHKTQGFVEVIRQALGAEEPRSLLIIASAFDRNTVLASGNLPWVMLMSALEVNVEHLLTFDRIIITREALQTLAGRTTKSS